MPRWQIASGVRPAIASPRNLIEPAVGARAPEMQLKHVVLPEPFGPMRPRISPSLTSKVTAFSAVKPPKRLLRPETASIRGRSRPPPKRSASRPRRRRRQRQEGRRVRAVPRIDDLELSLDHLEDYGERTLVLSGESVTGGVELHAVALHRAAVGDVGFARSLRERVRTEAAVFLDRAWQHVVEQDPQVIEAHRHVRGDRAVLFVVRAVASHHLRGHLTHPGLELFRVEELRGDRVEGVKALDVSGAERLLELVELAVAGTVADVRA